MNKTKDKLKELCYPTTKEALKQIDEMKKELSEVKDD